MLSRLNKPNLLAELVSSKNLNKRRADFIRMDGNSLDEFPKLTENDLYIIACGSYQRRLCSSYYAEHSKSDGRFEVQVCRHTGPLGLSSVNIQAEDPILIRGRIHSRFANRTKHLMYILIDVSKTGVDSIIEYCCQCKTGLRTIGCCAHAMVVLWYLGLGRYESEIARPANSLDEFYVDLASDSTDSE
jgi:hypothetical protein